MPQSTRLPAGWLNQRIRILGPNNAQDSFGGWQIGNVSIVADNLPAMIETPTARTLDTAQQKVSETVFRITIRWMKGIRSDMVVQWINEGDRFFQIQGIENSRGIRKYLVLVCTERDDSVRAA